MASGTSLTPIEAATLALDAAAGGGGGSGAEKESPTLAFQPSTYEELVAKSDGLGYPFPTLRGKPLDNRIATIAGDDEATQAEIADMAARVRPVAHSRVVALIESFIAIKRAEGSDVEKALYGAEGFGVAAMMDRMLTKRPLVFMDGHDRFLLKSGEDGASPAGFDAIGTADEAAPLVLADLQSYDEQQVAAVCGVSTPTHFINTSGRGNKGVAEAGGERTHTGVLVGLVGTRFEREERMAWKNLLVTEGQNTTERGYGPGGNALLQAWARFLGAPGGYFPTHAEAEEIYKREKEAGTENPRYTELVKWPMRRYLDLHLYKARCQIVAEIFLGEAQDRAAAEGKKAFCHVVGLGLGVWQVDAKQQQIMADAYADAAANMDLPDVADLNFSWFRSTTGCGPAGPGEVLSLGGNAIKIHINERDPADPLAEPEKLLVAMYAWDSNSYPGNEYWFGQLTASGDPAAACSCTISELQNPDINPAVCGANLHLISSKGPSSGVARYC